MVQGSVVNAAAAALVVVTCCDLRGGVLVTSSECVQGEVAGSEQPGISNIAACLIV